MCAQLQYPFSAMSLTPWHSRGERPAVQVMVTAPDKRISQQCAQIYVDFMLDLRAARELLPRLPLAIHSSHDFGARSARLWASAAWRPPITLVGKTPCGRGKLSEESQGFLHRDDARKQRRHAALPIVDFVLALESAGYLAVKVSKCALRHEEDAATCVHADVPRSTIFVLHKGASYRAP